MDNVTINGQTYDNVSLAFDKRTSGFQLASWVDDLDHDGYSDDDQDRDGYHDSDHNRDGYRDDDHDQGGFRDDDHDDDDYDDGNRT
ncbi:hypothetical protein [Thiolapillus sp.]